MAEKKAKTAQGKAVDAQTKRLCPTCGGDTRVTYFAGAGRKGFFWVCDKNCGYMARTK